MKSDHRLDPLLKLRFSQGADLRRGDLAVLEDHQCRNASHAILCGRLGVVVYIDFRDFYFSSHISSNLFQRRRDHLAGSAPFRPEIYKDWLSGFQNAAAKIIIRDLNCRHLRHPCVHLSCDAIPPLRLIQLTLSSAKVAVKLSFTETDSVWTIGPQEYAANLPIRPYFS